MRELHETPRRPSLRPSSASFFSFSTSDRFLAAEQIIRFRSFFYYWAEVFQLYKLILVKLPTPWRH